MKNPAQAKSLKIYLNNNVRVQIYYPEKIEEAIDQDLRVSIARGSSFYLGGYNDIEAYMETWDGDMLFGAANMFVPTEKIICFSY